MSHELNHSIKAELKRYRTAVSNQLDNNQAKDIGQYRHMTGQIKAIDAIAQFVNERLKED